MLSFKLNDVTEACVVPGEICISWLAC